MHTMIDQQKKCEKAILIALITPEQDEQRTAEYLDELSFLLTTAGAEEVGRFTQRCDGPNANTYVGTGKIKELAEYIEGRRQNDEPIDIAVFDDELSARQLRDINNALGVRILDRTSLILDIFAMRARTAVAKTQVELAQARYLLPRLSHMWTHLERQGGGSGGGGGKGSVGLRGPGETQLEIDRRIVLNRISLLKKRLNDIDRQAQTQRKGRGRLIRVALVGYTNVGKSTLLNLLTKSDVFAENKLFATLDTTVRKMVVENLPFLLTDTVGFIRKLPTLLIDAFRSTLDEVREADLLLHVVDIAHPNFEEQMEVTNQTLSQIGAGNIPQIVVFNKVDAYSYVAKDADDLTPRLPSNLTLEEREKVWTERLGEDCLFISATKRIGITALRKLLYQRVRQLHVTRYPYDDFLYPKFEE